MVDMSAFNCLDCGVNTSEIEEYYMLHDRVWRSVTNQNERYGMLCLGCIERRLGRLLEPTDFADVALNNRKSLSKHGSERMLDRLKEGSK